MQRLADTPGMVKRSLSFLILAVALLMASLFCMGRAVSEWVNLTAQAANTNQTLPSHYLSNALIDQHLTQRWNDQTRTIYVHIAAARQTPGWRPSMLPMVVSAFKEWQQAMNNRVTFEFTDDPNLMDVEVLWQGRSRGNEIGRQILEYRNQTITKANIEIAAINPNNQPFTDDQVHTIALHEIGHLLGIRGHSPYQGDVMYPKMGSPIKSLSARDRQTMRLLYQRTPDITNPSGIHMGQYEKYNQYVKKGLQAGLQNQNKQAYDYFWIASKAYPNSPEVHFFMGVSAFSNQQYTQAVSNLNTALNKPITPTMKAEAHFYLAESLARQGLTLTQDKTTQSEGIELMLKARSHYEQALNHPQLPHNLRPIANKNKLVVAKLGN